LVGSRGINAIADFCVEHGVAKIAIEKPGWFLTDGAFDQSILD
jgi:hypothetical protein